MTSALRSETARQNGAQSNGPTTEKGKATSARNALRHGLCARKFELRDDADQQAFDRLERDLAFTYRAVDEAQTVAVRQLAVAMWREQTLNAMEQTLVDAIMDGEASAENGGGGLPSMNSIYRYRARIERDLKSAKATLQELQAERVRAFQNKIEKAREFNELMHLGSLRDDLGTGGFEMFRGSVTNEPEQALATDDATPVMSRPERRRAEKLAKKQSK